MFDSIEIKNGKYSENLYGERFIDDNSISRVGQSEASIYEINGEYHYIDIIQPYLEEWGRHDYSIRYLFSLSSLEEMKQEMIITTIISSCIFILVSFYDIML